MKTSMRAWAVGLVWGVGCMACGRSAPPSAAPVVTAGDTEAGASVAGEPALHTEWVGLVADFETPGDVNNAGGKFGFWNSDVPDPKGICLTRVVEGGVEGGHALKIDYDITAEANGKGAYSGIWVHLNDFNASSFKKLVFQARSEVAGPDFYVELKNEGGTNVARQKATGVGGEWTTVEIPLERFFEITDWTKLTEMTFVFDHDVSASLKGSYLVDNIRFE